MGALKSVVGIILLSLYSSVLLKIYLDLFLHQASKPRQVAGWFLFFVWQFLSELDYFDNQTTLLCTFISIVLVGIVAYTGNWWKRWFFPIVYLAIWMLLEGVVAFGVSVLNGGVETKFAMISIGSKILMPFFVFGVRLFTIKMGFGKEPYGGGIYFFVFPVIGMGMYHILYQLVNHVQDSSVKRGFWMLLIAAALIVMNLCFYPIYIQLAQGLQMKKSVHFYRKQLELFKQEKELEENAMKEIRQLRHDMKQRLIFLHSLLTNGEIQAAQQVLEEMTGEALERGRLESRTGNMVVDSLVNHAWKAAQKEGILFHSDIRPMPDLPIKDVDLSVLLGNALDNAIEASGRMRNGKKEIWIFGGYEKGCLFFQVKNRYEGKLQMSWDKRIFTQKKEKGHGIGLYSMERIAQKYNGSVEVKQEEQGIFLVEMFICCGS